MKEKEVLLRARRAARTWAAKKRWFEAVEYEPHQGQEPFHRSQARWRILYAGSRLGKSIAAARDVGLLTVVPGTHTWIVAPTYDLGLKEFNYLWQDYAKTGWLQKALSKSESVEGPPHIRWADNTWLQVKSTLKPESLLGEELDCVIWSEAAQIETDLYWERYIRPRLLNRLGIAIWPTTPKGFNWVYRLFQNCQDKAKPDWEGWCRPTFDNPYISREELEAARETMSEQAYAEQVLGEPTSYAGLVYPNFDHVLNVVPWEWDKDFTTLCGIDCGFRRPAVIWAQEDGDGNVVVFDEFVGNDVGFEQLADVLIEKHDEYHVSYYFAGMEATHASRESGKTAIAAIRERSRAKLTNGRTIEVLYSTSPQQTSVSVGVELVRSMLCSADGRRRLFIARRIANPMKKRGIYSALGAYSYTEVRDGSTVKQEPKKDELTEDVMDALRYLCVNRFGTLGRRISKDQRWKSDEEREDMLERWKRWPVGALNGRSPVTAY